MSDDPPPPPRKKMVKLPTGGTAEGRPQPARLKTAKERRPSSQAWLERQINDPFASAARAKGYRSRAAFKLEEIDDKVHILTRKARVLDLGCAPGGWIQIALERGVTHIVGVDLLPVEPLPPAHILQMDFTDPECGPLLIEKLGGTPDVILSDMAPNTMGHRQTDHLRIVGLIEAAAAAAAGSSSIASSARALSCSGSGARLASRRLRSVRAKSSAVSLLGRGWRAAASDETVASTSSLIVSVPCCCRHPRHKRHTYMHRERDT